MAFVYNTATTANGYLADSQNSLEWLFAVEGDAPSLEEFVQGVTVLVLGSTTYEWVLHAEDLMNRPEQWAELFGQRPLFVFSSRDLAVPEGADVRVVNGPVSNYVEEIREVAGAGDVWIQGGGEVAGQFLDAGALDRITLTLAPAFLADGAPLFPRNLSPRELDLHGVRHIGQYVELTYFVN